MLKYQQNDSSNIQLQNINITSTKYMEDSIIYLKVISYLDKRDDTNIRKPIIGVLS